MSLWKKSSGKLARLRILKPVKDAFEALQENEYIRYDDLPLKAKDGQLDSSGICQQCLSWWATKK